MADFEDITIVDLDLKKTTWSRVHSSMRTLYLKLSREPDLDWVRFFQEERESRVVPTRHGMWIEDGYIVFDCLLRNVEISHLPDFRLSVAFANQRSRERRVERSEEIRQRRVDDQLERDRLDALRALIRKDGAQNGVASSLATQPESRAHVAIPPAPTGDEFNERRHQWRARFRDALNSRKETDDETH